MWLGERVRIGEQFPAPAPTALYAFYIPWWLVPVSNFYAARALHSEAVENNYRWAMPEPGVAPR